MVFFLQKFFDKATNFFHVCMPLFNTKGYAISGSQVAVFWFSQHPFNQLGQLLMQYQENSFTHV